MAGGLYIPRMIDCGKTVVLGTRADVSRRGVSYSTIAVRELLSGTAQDGGHLHQKKTCDIDIDDGCGTDKAKTIPGDERYNPGSYG